PITNRAALEPFLLTAELAAEYKATDALPKHIARQMEQQTGEAPKPKDRLSYIIAYFDDINLLHMYRAVTPTAFLENQHRLDVAWYLESQIMSCLKQIRSEERRVGKECR